MKTAGRGGGVIYPGATAPGDRAILVKHREHGWIEARLMRMFMSKALETR